MTLGEGRGEDITQALRELMPGADRWRRAAILSGAISRALELLETAVASDWPESAKVDWVSGLTATLLGARKTDDLAGVLRLLSSPGAGGATDRLEAWRVQAAERLLDSLRKQGRSLGVLAADVGPEARAAVAGFEQLLQRAAAAATAPGTDAALRQSSLQLLGAADTPAGRDVLMEIVGSAQWAEWQAPALTALGRSQRDEVAERLLAGWSQWSPSVRGPMIDVLLNRPTWTERLVAALEQGQVRAIELGPAQRQRLVRSSSADTRRRAEKALASATSGSSRAEVVGRYQSVNALSGNAERGTAVFDRSCAPCHRVRGHGFELGPNLAEFAGKSASDYLVAVLDPNAAINPNFVAYELETKDGRSLTGIVRHETASSLTLVQGSGVKEQILRSDVRQLRASSVSLMPEGLEQGFSAQELADLIAWLRGAPPAVFGRATPEQAAAARKEHFGAEAATKLDLVQAADRLSYPGWLGAWPLAYCRQNAGQDRLSWKARPGPARGSAGGKRFLFPAAMGFLSEPAGGFTLTVNGRSPVSFDVSLVDREWASADGKVRVHFSVREANGQDACGPLTVEWAGDDGTVEKTAKAGEADLVEFQVTARAQNSQRWFGVYLVEPGAR